VRNFGFVSLTSNFADCALYGLFIRFLPHDSHFLDSQYYPTYSHCGNDGVFWESRSNLPPFWSLALPFGISVDDTIHFLVKYRQELQANKWKIKKSVYLALRETGVSMFYTSIVLFFGFSVFMISSYGGYGCFGRIGVRNLALCDASQPDPFAVSLALARGKYCQ
jgi:hypothetical protein